MRHHRVLAALSVVTLFAAWVLAQKTTELYIPIGKSPGLSGTKTFIGTITAINSELRQVTIADADEEVMTDVTDRTTIYIDRSTLGQPSSPGTFNDLEDGLQVEVLSEETENPGEGNAVWIKLRAPS